MEIWSIDLPYNGLLCGFAQGVQSEVRPNDGKLEVFTREGPFGVARMRFRSSSIHNGEGIGFQKAIQKSK